MKNLIIALLLAFVTATNAVACNCNGTIDLAEQLSKKNISTFQLNGVTYNFRTTQVGEWHYLAVSTSEGKTLDMKEIGPCNGLTIHPSSQLDAETFYTVMMDWAKTQPILVYFLNSRGTLRSGGCEPASEKFLSPLRVPEAGW